MFIGVHQVSELWLKMLMHEVNGAVGYVRAGVLGPAFKMLSRASRIQEQLIQVWGVLSTMTPMDYAAFRDALGEASGFQSYQYRIVEFTLGNKNAALAKVHKHNPKIHAQVDAALRAPSLYDESLRLCARRDLRRPRGEASSATGRSPTRPTHASRRRGSPSTGTSRSTGTSTSSPRSSSTSRTASSAGASAT